MRYKYGKSLTGKKTHIYVFVGTFGQAFHWLPFCNVGHLFIPAPKPKKQDLCKTCKRAFHNRMDNAKQLEIEACED